MIITGRIISIGREDGYYPYKEDLIGEEVEFDQVDTKHFGSGWRRGAFRVTRNIISKGFRRLKGELFHFARVRVKIVEE